MPYVQVTMWLGQGLILEGDTRLHDEKGKPCGFWAGCCGPKCVNIFSNATMLVRPCVVSCERCQYSIRLRGEWHHKVRHHYAIITTTTMALTSLWVSWLQMSALYSTKPSHTLCKTRQRDMKFWVCLFISVCLDISVHVCIYTYMPEPAVLNVLVLISTGWFFNWPTPCSVPKWYK